MGANNGTGIPLFFRCAAARKDRRGWRVQSHTVKLTGKSKPTDRLGGIRNSKRSRQYECACGHVGWSKHVDLERLEASVKASKGDA